MFARARSNRKQQPVGLSFGGRRIFVLPFVQDDNRIKGRLTGLVGGGVGGRGGVPPAAAVDVL